ncbi:unnamed protein product [Periconia digitata]|uniref:Uncharacterized protein n=1 Tax=Periconia digitata TaxID=1303443 RepID=A0A9W4UCY7_9PLEO|nr:unnamed protein product [Periconia digitata]
MNDGLTCRRELFQSPHTRSPRLSFQMVLPDSVQSYIPGYICVCFLCMTFTDMHVIYVFSSTQVRELCSTLSADL